MPLTLTFWLDPNHSLTLALQGTISSHPIDHENTGLYPHPGLSIGDFCKLCCCANPCKISLNSFIGKSLGQRVTSFLDSWVGSLLRREFARDISASFVGFFFDCSCCICFTDIGFWILTLECVKDPRIESSSITGVVLVVVVTVERGFWAEVNVVTAVVWVELIEDDGVVEFIVSKYSGEIIEEFVFVLVFDNSSGTVVVVGKCGAIQVVVVTVVVAVVDAVVAVAGRDISPLNWLPEKVSIKWE